MQTCAEKLCLLVFLLVQMLGGTQLFAQDLSLASPKFQFSNDPDTLLITYSEIPEMLGNPDATPLIRVFGDGKVLVHYPRYMKRAGDYQLYLDRGELRRLLVAVAKIIDFDVGKATSARRDARNERYAASGEASESSDEVLTRIELSLAGYQARSRDQSRAIDRRVDWRSSGASVSEIGDLPELRGLDAAHNALRKLLDRPDLVRVPAKPALTRPLGTKP